MPSGYDCLESRFVSSRSPVGGAAASQAIAWQPLQLPYGCAPASRAMRSTSPVLYGVPRTFAKSHWGPRYAARIRGSASNPPPASTTAPPLADDPCYHPIFLLEQAHHRVIVANLHAALLGGACVLLD